MRFDQGFSLSKCLTRYVFFLCVDRLQENAGRAQLDLKRRITKPFRLSRLNEFRQLLA